MSDVIAAAEWIARLGLRPHPEGGAFAETYRAADRLATDCLPARFAGPRCASTAIVFLLRAGEVSRLHRLRSDEVWHFYAGGGLRVYALLPGGELRTHRLGSDPRRGEVFQAVVPHGAWFGAALDPDSAYALVGCTVAPGFDFADFELGRRAALLGQFPQHRELIERLTA